MSVCILYCECVYQMLVCILYCESLYLLVCILICESLYLLMACRGADVCACACVRVRACVCVCVCVCDVCLLQVVSPKVGVRPLQNLKHSGNLVWTGWSEYGLSQAHSYH